MAWSMQPHYHRLITPSLIKWSAKHGHEDLEFIWVEQHTDIESDEPLEYQEVRLREEAQGMDAQELIAAIEDRVIDIGLTTNGSFEFYCIENDMGLSFSIPWCTDDEAEEYYANR
jgi:hypothetical protein